MAKPTFKPQLLRDLTTDLTVEMQRLERQRQGLLELEALWQQEGANRERVDAAALRLQSFYTGIERGLLQIVRLLNGGVSEGADWHRRLLDRLTLPTDRRPAVLSTGTAAALAELLRFRHRVRHLYADDLDPAQVLQRLQAALELWPGLEADLRAFRRWLEELIALAEEG